MSYTVFHLGVYISLLAALFAAQHFNAKLAAQWWFAVVLSCFMVAGICGAAVGSNIPEFKTWTEYCNAEIGFWIGILIPLGGFLFFGPKFIPRQ